MSTLYNSVGHIRTNVMDNASSVALCISRTFDPLFLSSYRIHSGDAPACVSYSGSVVLAKLRVSCLAARRHLRRRDNGLRAPQMRPNDSENVDRVGSSRNHKWSEDKVVITFDMEEWKNRVTGGVAGVKRAAQRSVDLVVRATEEFADESREAWMELRSSVRIQKDKRVVIAVKRSTIDFTGKLLLWSIVGTVLGKFLINAMREYRWGWEEFSGPRKSVRDRSLGGREMLVSSGFKQRGGGLERRNLSFIQGVNNPLDGVESSRSEKILKSRTDRETAAGVKTKAARLPGWWPGAFMPPSASIITRQDAEEKAQSLMKGIMQKRLIGYEFSFEDMIELRQLCKTAGIKVKFDTPNTRDTFYRAAINYVLTACCSSAGDESVMDFGIENGVTFIAGLANNIGLEEDRAATMVNAGVAARTRAGLLQVRALQLQGKFKESEEEVVKIIRMHSYFPPDSDSPEMELVARGLDSQFNREGKLKLLELYEKMGGSKTRRVAEEALGLHLFS